MVVIWKFRENHILRLITKDLARIQPRNKVRAKKVARGEGVSRIVSQKRRVAREKDSLERKNKSREGTDARKRVPRKETRRDTRAKQSSAKDWTKTRARK